MKLSLCILISLVVVSQSEAAYPMVEGCNDLSDNDFQQVSVISKFNHPQLHEPIQMDFDVNDDGNVDIFFVERLGAVKKYDGTSGQVSTIMTVPATSLSTGFEDGLMILVSAL